MSKVRHLPYPENGKRVETGAVQFGDDWKSYHLRGDDALYLANIIGQLKDKIKLESPMDRINKMNLTGFAEDILQTVDESKKKKLNEAHIQD